MKENENKEMELRERIGHFEMCARVHGTGDNFYRDLIKQVRSELEALLIARTVSR